MSVRPVASASDSRSATTASCALRSASVSGRVGGAAVGGASSSAFAKAARTSPFDSATDVSGRRPEALRARSSDVRESLAAERESGVAKAENMRGRVWREWENGERCYY